MLRPEISHLPILVDHSRKGFDSTTSREEIPESFDNIDYSDFLCVEEDPSLEVEYEDALDKMRKAILED